MEYDYAVFLKELGARVKQLRRDKGWSLRDMIVLHGYHDTQWRKIERGEGISIPSLLKLACLFDLTVSTLLDGLGEAQNEAKAATDKSQPESKATKPVKRTKRLQASPRASSPRA